MSKAVTNGAHWLGRKSQFSLHAQRNGRVDILPPNAKMPTFGELRERYNEKKRVFQEKNAAYIQIRDEVLSYSVIRNRKVPKSEKLNPGTDIPSWLSKKLDELAQVKHEMCAASAKLQDFKVIFRQVENATYERIWIETARAMLPWDVVDQIDGVVHQNFVLIGELPRTDDA